MTTATAVKSTVQINAGIVADRIEQVGHYPHVGNGACIVANNSLPFDERLQLADVLRERLNLGSDNGYLYEWNDTSPTAEVVAVLRDVEAGR